MAGDGVTRVGLVDDDSLVRAGLAMILGADPGIEVVGTAADGAEALDVVAATRPDVLLLDLRMPVMDGVATLRALAELEGPGPRVLVLTTYDTDQGIRAAFAAGADGLLLKDARREELVRAVHDLAGGSTVLTPSTLAVLAAPATPMIALSARETEVLRLVAEGCTNRAVASRLGIGEATVKTHLLHVYEKLGAADRASAVRTAWERGLV